MRSLKSFFKPPPRLRLESLEDRVQPSVLLQQPSGILASGPVQAAPQPLTPLQAQVSVAELLGGQGGGALSPQSIDYATYVTGTPHTATGEAVAVDSSDSQYVVGSVVLDLSTGGTATFGYIAKYLPHGTTFDPSFNGGAPLAFRLSFNIAGTPTTYDIDLHGVAVDTDPAQGNIDVVGSGTNTATGNQLAVFVTFDPTGTTLLGGAGFGAATGTDPNNLTGIAADGAGDVVATGQFFVNGTGNLAFAVLPDATTSVQGFFYDFSPTFTASAGNGIAIDSGVNFAYVAGTVTDPSSGALLGFAGQIDINNMLNLNGVTFTDQGGGNIVLNGAAVNSGSGESYFVGTAPNNGGTAGLVLRFTNDPVTGFTFDQNASLELTDDPQNSISLTGVAVDQNSGNVYLVGSALNTVSGNLNVLLGQFDDVLTQGTANTALVGASGTDTGAGVAVTSTGSIAVVGTTTSPDFSTDGSALNGAQDAFLMQFTF
jgi:hypothetical protein